MPLDGILLHKIIEELQPLTNGQINKIQQVSQNDLLFHIKNRKDRYQLLISAHPQYHRIALTKTHYQTIHVPGSFLMLLRKHLENGRIQSIQQADLDRWLTITIDSRDEIGDPVRFDVVVELMGKYANVILVLNGTILDALKRIPLYENSKRLILPNASFIPVEAQDKRNPFTDPSIDPTLPLHNQFSGFSPMLDKEFCFRMNQGETFEAILKEVEASTTLYLSTQKDRQDYHCIALTHLLAPITSFPLMSGLETWFYQHQQKERIRESTGDLAGFLRKHIKKEEGKLSKLQQALHDAQDNHKWQVYGDLLLAYPQNIEKGATAVTLPDFETNDPITIPLDPKLDVRGNAKRCFNLYRKGKNGQIHIQQQIDLTLSQIAYLQGLQEQLTLADLEDANEIREELVRYRFLKPVKKPGKNKQKPEYHYTVFYFHDARILVGKNNTQNDYLTFHLAHKEDWFFHAKDYHGAHVILQCETINEELIRICGNLAACYSQGKDSSSVPINYTQVKNVKKIPGSRIGFVRLGTYQTIYIDPDINQVNQLSE